MSNHACRLSSLFSPFADLNDWKRQSQARNEQREAESRRAGDGTAEGSEKGTTQPTITIALTPPSRPEKDIRRMKLIKEPFKIIFPSFFFPLIFYYSTVAVHVHVTTTAGKTRNESFKSKKTWLHRRQILRDFILHWEWWVVSCSRENFCLITKLCRRVCTRRKAKIVQRIISDGVFFLYLHFLSSPPFFRWIPFAAAAARLKKKDHCSSFTYFSTLTVVNF